MHQHVTLLSGLRLQPGSEESHQAFHEAGVRSAAAMGGLVRAELVPAVPGVQDETVALLTFASRKHLDAWLSSPQRAKVLDEMAHLAMNERSLNVLSGFPGWFASGAAVPVRWKQALVVIAGLIPVSLIVTELRQLVLPDVGLLGAVVINAIGNVCVLTWLVMPSLTRLLSGWLVPTHLNQHYSDRHNNGSRPR